MKIRSLRLALGLASSIVALSFAGSEASAQGIFLERPAGEPQAVTAPADRVEGKPGSMRVVGSACRSLPLATARRRIVDLAAQEWAYFGFSVTDRALPGPVSSRMRSRSGRWRGASRMQSSEFARLAPSIAGYWAATPGGTWALDRQNGIWDRSGEIGSRWRDPWSAAFISWVICEAGVGAPAQFDRSIAHREYIDQAIRARDGREPAAAYVAYDMGEASILPGDLLCSSKRSGYQSIDQRRKQMGRSASTHCDVVVSVDEPGGVILAIGGNVYGTVSLKRLPAVRDRGRHLHPRDDIFAHLKLKADAIGVDALSTSPTIAAMACTKGFEAPSQVAVLGLDLEKRVCR